jgi:hypothetical protein
MSPTGPVWPGYSSVADDTRLSAQAAGRAVKDKRKGRRSWFLGFALRPSSASPHEPLAIGGLLSP